MEVLSEVLRALRLQGTVYFEADFCSPWGMNLAGGQVANFHVVTEGTCWVRANSLANPLELKPGDLILFPHGEPHALVSHADGETIPAQKLIATPKESDGTRPVFGGNGQATRLICGHFEYDRALAHPLMAGLPDHIFLPKRAGSSNDWIQTATELTVAEAAANRDGSSAVVDRLAEVLLIQAVRQHLSDAQTPQSFVHALNDAALGKALKAIHDAPAHPWDLQTLAQLTNTSRSVFASRFKDALGVPPMQYVTDWRLQKARQLLRENQNALAEVGLAVGYQSEFAFAKAFKRHFGIPPGQYRQSAKTATG